MGQRHARILIVLLLCGAAPPGEVQRVPPQQVLAILGRTVTDQSGTIIGRLVDVLVGDQGQPQAAVIDFGGFMGVGSRKIAVQWGELHFAPGNAKRPISLDLTQDQIKAAPEYTNAADPAPVVVAPAARVDTTTNPAQR